MGDVVRMVCGALLMVAAGTARAQCPDDPMQFTELVDSMETEPGAEQRVAVDRAVRCLTTVPHRRDLARAYVMMGADAYATTGRFTTASAFFCSARGARSDIVPHPALVPEDAEHPLRRAWLGRCPVVLDTVRSSVPLWVDGQESVTVPGLPASRPYLVQYQLDDGSWSSQLVPEGGLPSVPEEERRRRERWVAPTIGVVALAGFAAAVWYGTSINGRNPGREEW